MEAKRMYRNRRNLVQFLSVNKLECANTIKVFAERDAKEILATRIFQFIETYNVPNLGRFTNVN